MKNLNELAAELLRDGKVDVIVGYSKVQRELASRPIVIENADEADQLIFDRTCENNLVKYLHRLKGKKVGIVVKGCDERSVVGLIQELQVKREDLVLIGASCKGVVDRRLIWLALDRKPFENPRLDGDKLFVTLTSGFEQEIPVNDVIYTCCRNCFSHNPRFADYLINEPVEQPAVASISPKVAENEAKSCDERWDKFSQEMDKCIMCFACRNVCPACYCETCFTEATKPRWMSKTDDPADAMFFHFTRLQHLAGRCTGCGACERACPVEVDLRLYNDKLRKDVNEMFDFIAGDDPEAKQPLSCYCLEDNNDIFK